MKKIAIIEDDLGISASLKLYLENSDFDIITHSTGDKAPEFIISETPDLVILDINLPVMDGIEVCSEVRKNSQVPIIMLTARG
jgi:DNA-binding response OmpR family regulator